MLNYTVHCLSINVVSVVMSYYIVLCLNIYFIGMSCYHTMWQCMVLSATTMSSIEYHYMSCIDLKLINLCPAYIHKIDSQMTKYSLTFQRVY